MTRKEIQQELAAALKELKDLNGQCIRQGAFLRGDVAWAVAGARGHINDALEGLSELEAEGAKNSTR